MSTIPKALPSLEELNKYFEADFENGLLINKVSRGRAKKGESAGCKLNTGYFSVCFKGAGYLRHRILYYMFTGEQPALVDHKNNTPGDDRIDNLREGSKSTNAANTVGKKDKPRGVFPNGSGFFARIMKDGELKYLGQFSSQKEAADAYDKASVELFGEFAFINNWEETK